MIALKRLQEYWLNHPASERSLTWYRLASHVSSKNIFDVRKSLNSVDICERRTIFDIGGNKYRLIARVNFKKQVVYVLYILTHAELATITFDEKRYAKFLAKYLPRIPENDAENERLTGILLELDEKRSLLPEPEEDALFENVVLMVQHYEQKHYPIKKLFPAENLRTVMEDRGLKHKDLAEIIGNKSLTSQILNGNREISKAVARKLSDGLGLSIELFL